MSVYSNDRDPNDISWERENSKEVLHTQLEWRISEDGCDIEAVYDGGSFGICSMYATEATQANAEIIVKAVNNYQKLLDSNRELLEIVKYLLPKFSPDTMSEVEEKKRITTICNRLS